MGAGAHAPVEPTPHRASAYGGLLAVFRLGGTAVAPLDGLHQAAFAEGPTLLRARAVRLARRSTLSFHRQLASPSRAAQFRLRTLARLLRQTAQAVEATPRLFPAAKAPSAVVAGARSTGAIDQLATPVEAASGRVAAILIGARHALALAFDAATVVAAGWAGSTLGVRGGHADPVSGVALGPLRAVRRTETISVVLGDALAADGAAFPVEAAPIGGFTVGVDKRHAVPVAGRAEPVQLASAPLPAARVTDGAAARSWG